MSEIEGLRERLRSIQENLRLLGQWTQEDIDDDPDNYYAMLQRCSDLETETRREIRQLTGRSMRDLLTIAEAATELGVSRQRVQAFIHRKRNPLKAEKAGARMWLIDRKDLEAFKAQERKPGKPRKR